MAQQAGAAIDPAARAGAPAQAQPMPQPVQHTPADVAQARDAEAPPASLPAGGHRASAPPDGGRWGIAAAILGGALLAWLLTRLVRPLAGEPAAGTDDPVRTASRRPPRTGSPPRAR
ncbi:MAG: hypothetical protein QM750_00640 [Rubrivivax sp.]